MKIPTHCSRRGLSTLEVLISLAISAALMAAVLGALVATFEGYRRTADSVSANVSGRLIIERAQVLIRGAIDFKPLPSAPTDAVVESDYLEIQMPDESWVTIAWDSSTETLRWEEGVDSWLMLEGVSQIPSGAKESVSPFRLTFADGRWLTSATIDLVIDGDDVAGTDLDGGDIEDMRFIGSAIPRRVVWAQ